MMSRLGSSSRLGHPGTAHSAEKRAPSLGCAFRFVERDSMQAPGRIFWKPQLLILQWIAGPTAGRCVCPPTQRLRWRAGRACELCAFVALDPRFRAGPASGRLRHARRDHAPRSRPQASGGRSSIGRALGCGPRGHGFDSRRPPQISERPLEATPAAFVRGRSWRQPKACQRGMISRLLTVARITRRIY